GRPPVKRVRREHPRPDDGRGEACLRDKTLDVGVEDGHWIRLLKERMRRAVRCGEKDDPLRVGCEALDDGRNSGRWRGPDKENRTDTLQRGVERFRHGEV